MGKTNWLRLAGINLLIAVIIVLPFLPGPPNQIVTGLSMFAQSAGFFGLIVVPIGLFWVLLEIKKMYSGPPENPKWKTPYYLAVITMCVLTPLAILLCLAIFHQTGPLAGAAVLILGAFVGSQAITAIKRLKRPAPFSKLHPMPFYLLTIPLIAFVTRSYVMEPLSDYSRTATIERSQELIDAIEGYKNREGQYPASIQELESAYLNKIPGPSIMGVSNFRYNKINDDYSLSFSQWLEFGSLEEIVLYDKNNLKNNLTGEFAKYDYKFDLCRVKGAIASHDTGYDHWRYYHCD